MKLNLLEPRATEKTYAESFKRTYVFPIKKSTTKQEIAKLVAKEFNVTVVDVRTLLRKGKKTKYSKGKHAYPGTTYRQDKKFAYVTLKEGDSIKVFEEQNDNTSAKDAKKADKNAGKEKK
ncbi:50S ribosomal protein L23 [Candidatus Saccharibacteria bacterium]|nr:50S ribosomal protein L23 [Candidatus Saccharibacteria bacterium]